MIKHKPWSPRSLPDPVFIIPLSPKIEKKQKRLPWLVKSVILPLGAVILLATLARFLHFQRLDNFDENIKRTDETLGKDEDIKQTENERTSKYWRGAVVEHSVVSPVKCMEKICSRDEALTSMKPNILTYSTFITEAAMDGVYLILFPEDGLTGFEFSSRDHMLPLLQVVPDPRNVTDWVPCEQPSRFGNMSELLEIFSCLAKDNIIFIGVNLGDWQVVDGKELAYNTDVVFDREGRLVARYHKRHLFKTEYSIYDRPELEVVTFDTEFGKFGIMTCFDALYAHPFLDLVEAESIDSLLFLTAWWNSPPIFTSLGFHSSLAASAGINYLAANRNYPPKNQTGSGIYTTAGVLASWTADTYPLSKMLIADIPVSPAKRQVNWSEAAKKLSPIIPLAEHAEDQIKFFDVYNMTLVAKTGHHQVCQGTLCCIVHIEKFTEKIKLGAFQGLHTKGGKYRMEVCLLMKEKDQKEERSERMDKENKREKEEDEKEKENDEEEENVESKVWMAGLFSTKYVYPQVLFSGGHVGEMDIGKGGILKSTTSGFQTMVLLGRNYQKSDSDL